MPALQFELELPLPRVEKNDTEAGEVLNVPRYEGKAVFKGSGSNDAVHHRQREPFLLRARG